MAQSLESLAPFEFPYDCPTCKKQYFFRYSAQQCCQSTCDNCRGWYLTGIGDEIPLASLPFPVRVCSEQCREEYLKLRD